MVNDLAMVYPPKIVGSSSSKCTAGVAGFGGGASGSESESSLKVTLCVRLRVTTPSPAQLQAVIGGHSDGPYLLAAC